MGSSVQRISESQKPPVGLGGVQVGGGGVVVDVEVEVATHETHETPCTQAVTPGGTPRLQVPVVVVTAQLLPEGVVKDVGPGVVRGMVGKREEGGVVQKVETEPAELGVVVVKMQFKLEEEDDDDDDDDDVDVAVDVGVMAVLNQVGSGALAGRRS